MTRPTTTGKAQDLITFTRSTTGTYLGSDGLLKSAAINEARIEYDASGNCLGLLVEEARTNKVLYSEDFSNSVWTKNGNGTGTAPVVTASDIVAPDGTFSGNKVVFDKGNGANNSDFSIIQNSISSITASSTVWLKANENVRIMARASNTFQPLDVTTKWQRFTVETNVTCTGLQIGLRGNAGVSGIPTAATVYMWGAQVEHGSFPTSYIPTSGSAITRAADVASLAVSEFGYNQDQGTVVAQATSFYLGTNRETVISTADASSNLGVYVGKTAGGGDIDALYAGEGGSNTYFSLGAITEDTSYKFAFAIKTDDFAGSKDGGAVVTDTSGTQRTSITDLGIGSRKNGVNRLNGHIKSIQYYPLRLSNAQLQALTV